MPVNIPTIQRAQTADTMVKNDRFNFQVQDQGQNILAKTQAVAGVANASLDVYQKIEDNTINDLANKAEQDWTVWNNGELTKLKQVQGDPTDAYVEYDKKAKEKYESMLASRPDVSDRVTRHVTTRLNKTISDQNVAVLKQRGAQQETYSNNIYESHLKIKKDTMPVVAGYINKGDDSSYFMFNQSMNDVSTAIAKRGLKVGTVKQIPEGSDEKPDHVYKDDDGKTVKVKMDPIAQARRAKELSEGVNSSLQVMIAGGRLDEATEMREKYKGYITPLDQSKLQKTFDKAGSKQEAYKVLNSLGGKSEDQQITAIEKLPDGPVKSEVLKIKETDDARLASQRTRREKVNKERALDRIDELKKNGQLFGISDLEKDTEYSLLVDKLDHKSQAEIKKYVEAPPKESDPDASLKLNKLMSDDLEGEDVEDMSFTDFNRKIIPGLNEAEKNKAIKWYQKQKNPTAGEQRATNKRAKSLLVDYLYADKKYLKEDTPGFLNRESKQKVNAANDELMDLISSRPGVSDKELKDIVKDFAKNKILGQPYTLPERKKFKSSSDNTVSENPFNLLDKTSQLRLQSKWKYGPGKGIHPSEDVMKTSEFKQFVIDNK